MSNHQHRPCFTRDCPLGRSAMAELLIILRQVLARPELMRDTHYRDTVEELLNKAEDK